MREAYPTTQDPAEFEEVTVGLSLMCALPDDVAERALLSDRKMLLIMTRSLRFSWETTMSLLFLGAKGHRLASRELKELKNEFGRLNIETSRGVLKSHPSRKATGDTELQPAGAAR